MDAIFIPQIKATYDYAMFHYHKCNRKVTSKKILKAIVKKDLTPYCPILVDKDYNIVDGQHRFDACRTLGKPVYYIILEDNEDNTLDTPQAIMDINTTSNPWRVLEHLHFHSTTKGGCWTELEEFDNRHGFGISNSMVIFPLRSINARQVREGKIHIEKHPLREEMADFLKSEEAKMLSFHRTRPFVLAVRKAHETYTPKELTKLKKKLVCVPHCADFEQYMTVFNNLLKKR